MFVSVCKYHYNSWEKHCWAAPRMSGYQKITRWLIYATLLAQSPSLTSLVWHRKLITPGILSGGRSVWINKNTILCGPMSSLCRRLHKEMSVYYIVSSPLHSDTVMLKCWRCGAEGHISPHLSVETMERTEPLWLSVFAMMADPSWCGVEWGWPTEPFFTECRVVWQMWATGICIVKCVSMSQCCLAWSRLQLFRGLCLCLFCSVFQSWLVLLIWEFGTGRCLHSTSTAFVYCVPKLIPIPSKP